MKAASSTPGEIIPAAAKDTKSPAPATSKKPVVKKPVPPSPATKAGPPKVKAKPPTVTAKPANPAKSASKPGLSPLVPAKPTTGAVDSELKTCNDTALPQETLQGSAASAAVETQESPVKSASKVVSTIPTPFTANSNHEDTGVGITQPPTVPDQDYDASLQMQTLAAQLKATQEQLKKATQEQLKKVTDNAAQLKATQEQLKKVTDNAMRETEMARESQIVNQNCATSGFEMCYAPSTFGAGAKHVSNSA